MKPPTKQICIICDYISNPLLLNTIASLVDVDWIQYRFNCIQKQHGVNKLVVEQFFAGIVAQTFPQRGSQRGWQRIAWGKGAVG